MQDMLIGIYNDLVARTAGTMPWRFLLHPGIALLYAIKAGTLDARTNTVPYLWHRMLPKPTRQKVAKDGWRYFAKIFLMALAIDMVYQVFVIHRLGSHQPFYPIESVVVALLLAIVPYLLLRGPVSSVVRHRLKDKPADEHPPAAADRKHFTS